MWNKPSEKENIRRLRVEALAALGGRPPLNRNIRLSLTVHVGPHNQRSVGDLDNFITGICDALQCAHPGMLLIGWAPDEVHPTKCIAVRDDVEIVQITASKIIGEGPQFYELTLEGEIA